MTIHASKPGLAELYPFLCLFSFTFFFFHILAAKGRSPHFDTPNIQKLLHMRNLCSLRSCKLDA